MAMSYEQMARELIESSGASNARDITFGAMVGVAWKWAQENPDLALDSFKDSIGQTNLFWDELMKHFGGIGASENPKHGIDYTFIGHYFVAAVVESVREDLQDKMNEYWGEYAQENFQH
jgi:hypothetical protein